MRLSDEQIEALQFGLLGTLGIARAGSSDVLRYCEAVTFILGMHPLGRVLVLKDGRLTACEHGMMYTANDGSPPSLTPPYLVVLLFMKNKDMKGITNDLS